ncbi:MAG TPA: 30S ribosomal protein S16 [Coleofasciculaceae cyanobacterium]
MIKLRLKRFGKKFEASYRIVAMNNDTRRDGRPLEELGFYNPRTDEVKLDVPATVRRLQQGAQPTRTVKRLLEKANVYEQATATPAAAPAATTP